MPADNQYDALVKHLCRLDPVLRKALDKTRLVQVPVRYRKKDGTMGTRLQWVDKNSKEAKEYAAHKQDEPAAEKKAAKDQKKTPRVKKTDGSGAVSVKPGAGDAKKTAKAKPEDAKKAAKGGPDGKNGQDTYAETGDDSGEGAQAKKSGAAPKPIGEVKTMPDMHFVESSKDVPDWITEQTGKIPPGWRFIQIADDKDADRLVCGYDYEGRMQTKYSRNHEQRQAREKFKRVAELRENEEKIAEGIRGIKNEDVRDCLSLIMETGLRPGSEKSAKGGHFGATTLLAEHVVVEKTRVYLRFIGKEGVIHNHEVTNPDLRKMLKARKRKAEKTADRRLFKTSPDMLNRQFKAVTGCVDTSVKDLRTMKACSTAYNLLRRSKTVTTAKGFDSLRKRIGTEVCGILGNGRDMALGSYIDPRLFIAHSPEGYRKWKEAREKKIKE